MEIKDFMEAVNYRFEGVGGYTWNSYGKDCYYLDYNDVNKNVSASLVYSTSNMEVMEFTVCDYIKNLAFRWINSDYEHRHMAEIKYRGIVDEAWDDPHTLWTPMNETNILSIAKLIISSSSYDHTSYKDVDKMVSVDIDLEEDEWYVLMLAAHNANVTLNEFVNRILRDHIEKLTLKDEIHGSCQDDSTPA